jgi:hypothetical protein
MIGFISTWVKSLLITLKDSAIFDLHNFQFTVAHTLGFPVFTSRLLATDLNTEISTSAHYEVFLLFRLKSFWNLGINILLDSLLQTPRKTLSLLLLTSLHKRKCVYRAFA